MGSTKGSKSDKTSNAVKTKKVQEDSSSSEEEEESGTDELKKDVLRGGTNLALGEAVQNFMIIEGTEPGKGVKADTKLIADTFSVFK